MQKLIDEIGNKELAAVNNYRVEITPDNNEIRILKDDNDILVLSRKIEDEVPKDVYCVSCDTLEKKAVLKTLFDTGWFVYQDHRPFNVTIGDEEILIVEGFRFRQDFLNFELDNQMIIKTIWNKALELGQDDFVRLYLDVMDYYMIMLPSIKELNFQISKTKGLTVRTWNSFEEYPSVYATLSMSFHKFLMKAVKDYGFSYHEEKIIKQKLLGI